MKDQRRTQADRSAATREALIRAARPLFAADGFGAVSAEAIARAAGVTRGAMYHQFADKTEVYAAVLEEIEDEVMARISTGIAEADQGDLVEVMKVGARIWLDACADPGVYKIVLIEAPSVLGWERWREVSMRHGMGMVQALIQGAIDSGRIPPQPVLPLAHVLIGALDEAAIYLARSDSSARTRAEVDTLIDRLVDALFV